jgi:SAM-dependent MidA family methyltransferase
MSPLAQYLRELITQEGPLTLERYMSLALGHPTMGYYITRDPLGAAGDFTTAPEISQMFGELLGLWAAETWVSMGAPTQVRLIELGPGRGTLMQDALRAASVVPAFAQSIDVHLVETSPELGRLQHERLQHSGVPITWHSDVKTLPPGPAIIIANEFFDALPVRHYLRDGRGWRERLVGLDPQGRFTFGLAQDYEQGLSVDAPPGSIIEVCPIAQQIITQLAERIKSQGGAALIIDYGYTQTALGETLQALKAHHFVDPLEEPGQADLTTHVDFAALARAAHAAGAAIHGPLTQGDFLTRLGIFDRAQALAKHADDAQFAQIESALVRLVSPDKNVKVGGASVDGMGDLFKVLCISAPDLATPSGFAEPQS